MFDFRGIPFVCDFKDERISAITEALSKGQHDIVLLQEVTQGAATRLDFLIVSYQTSKRDLLRPPAHPFSAILIYI